LDAEKSPVLCWDCATKRKRGESVDIEHITNAKDVQVGGNHYKNMKIQPTEFIHANDIPFIEANVIKYVCRHRHKNGLEDIKKAIHFLQLLIEFEYEPGEDV
jgi:hypothetical protein